jgi:hypothetical protein
VICADLLAPWLSADQNCELCRSASHRKEAFDVILEELFIHLNVIPTQTIIRFNCDSVTKYLEFIEFWTFCKFQSKHNLYLFYKSWTPKCIRLTVWQLHSVQLHIVTATQCDRYPVPHTAICRRRNKMIPWIKDTCSSEMFNSAGHYRQGSLYWSHPSKNGTKISQAGSSQGKVQNFFSPYRLLVFFVILI